VLDAPEPAAYCLSGRPATIVLTSAAVALLDPGQLAAVLAHERAHLAGRHHVLIALSRGLAASFPSVPLFAQGYQSVRRLAEMCADDAAARRSGPGPVVAALLAMATRTPVPASALGAATWAVTDRVRRLLDAPPGSRQAWCRVALTAVTLVVAALPTVVAALAG
jgi:beta-lactamase regulating signal transducer with metallopeptidase domain